MSAPTIPGPPPLPRLHGVDRVRHFWQRISEGRQIDELWSHFTADARASYGFYMKESDAEELQGSRGVRRWFRIAKVHFSNNFTFDINLETVAALSLLFLLSLELADKVTMKRDLEIAREIQTWLVP